MLQGNGGVKVRGKGFSKKAAAGALDDVRHGSEARQAAADEVAAHDGPSAGEKSCSEEVDQPQDQQNCSAKSNQTTRSTIDGDGAPAAPPESLKMLLDKRTQERDAAMMETETLKRKIVELESQVAKVHCQFITIVC